MIAPSPLGWSEAISLGDLLQRQAAVDGSRPALVLPGERRTYAELAAGAARVAASLIGLGVRHGEHVGMLLPNGVEALETIFGVALAGAVLVPINVRFRAAELGHIVRDGDLAAIITVDPTGSYTDFVALLGQALPGFAEASRGRIELEAAPSLRAVVALGGEGIGPCIAEAEFTALGEGVTEAELRERRARVALRDPALVLYTSGTTSAPRGCLITHEGLVRNWTTVGRRLRMSAEDRVWNPLPLFHVGGIGVTILTFSHGAALIADTHFEPDAAFAAIGRERPTVLYPVFPPIMLALINDPRFERLDLTAVRAMSTVGDPKLIRRVQAAIPGAVHVTTYGLTETSGISTYHDIDAPLELRMATAGSPQPGIEVRTVNPETGIETATGVPGEIRIRGWNVFAGYYGRPERSAEAFDAAGWLRTDDQGWLDDDGHLHFEGRLDEMIKVGGENTSPAEVEAFLGSHPAVHMAQVVGVPDPRLGEVAAAFLELKPGAEFDEAALLEFCDGEIARFKVPRHVRFVREWPMSATKVQKSALRESLLEELAASGGEESR